MRQILSRQVMGLLEQGRCSEGVFGKWYQKRVDNTLAPQVGLNGAVLDNLRHGYL